MQQLTLKKDLEKSKMRAFLHFLKSQNIEAELKTTPAPKATPAKPKEKGDLSLSVGLWKDYDLEAKELRKKKLKQRQMILVRC